MSLTFAKLWHERQRFIPAILAVAFSAILVMLQTGLLLGTFAVVSLPVDHAQADIWVGSPDLLSVEGGQPIPRRWASRLNLPAIAQFEFYQRGFINWHKPSGGFEMCMLLGAHLQTDSLGAIAELDAEARHRLREPGSVAVDATALAQLGLTRAIGEFAEANGHRIRVVALLQGLKAITVPYVLCSFETAKRLLSSPVEQTGFLLARCRDSRDAPAVAAHLRRYHDMSTFTKEELSWHSRRHWLLMTGGGLAIAFTSVLGLLVGAVITSQALFGAIVSSLREYAMLTAMGIPRRRIGAQVVIQSVVIGLVGVGLAFPAAVGMKSLAGALGVPILLQTWMVVTASAVTLLMAVLSGFAALRSLKLVEPAVLLR